MLAGYFRKQEISQVSRFKKLNAENGTVGGLIMWLTLLNTGFPIAWQSCLDARALHKTIPDTWADHNRPPTIKYSVAGEHLPERVCDISFQRLNARGIAEKQIAF